MPRIFVYEHLSGSHAADAASHELLAMGLAMRDAIVADLLRFDGAVVSCADAGDRAPPAVPGRLQVVAPADGEAAFDFVARQCTRHDLAWVVAPECDGLLQRFQAAVGAQRWIGCRPPALVIASSKALTRAALAAAGIPTPLAFDGAAAARWVVKPDDGAGAVDTVVHLQREAALADLGQRRAAGRTATIEAYVDGDALSVALHVRHGRAVVLACNRQRVTLGADGRLSYRGVDVDALGRARDPRVPALRELATQVVDALPGLDGFVGIDLVWHPQRGPVVIEVNPRVTCAYVGLSARLRRNVGAEILAARFETETAGG